MSNFDLSPPAEEEADGKVIAKHTLETFCWLYREGDALLATGGNDGLIRIISVANSEEISVLKGHNSK
jgi:WD40 repeat protein